MVSRHKVMRADWYSRVVFGVIAAALVTLVVQGGFAVEPVEAAQVMQCGSRANPCYVQFPENVLLRSNTFGGSALKVHVVNPVRTVGK